jgi:hypothetical protein
MAETGPLLFLLAPVEALGADRLSDDELQAVQARGVSSAFGLRIVVVSDPGGQFNRVCDAITPRFEPERLWLGVYHPSPTEPGSWQQLDRFPLSEAPNQSCWFYPTHDGHYLSWQRELQVTLGPGRIADCTPHPAGQQPLVYSREQVALLWTLLGDDTNLTCVGLTYAGRRIDWPLQQRQWADGANWSDFSVDSSRAQPLVVHASWVAEADGVPSAEGPPAGRITPRRPSRRESA